MEKFERTQILVLGSTHLHSLGDRFNPKLLDRLVETLKRFKPNLICIENLSGEVIERMQRGGDEETPKRFASGHIRFAKKAQKLVGLSRIEAEKRSRKIVHQKLTNQQRLELILLFLAAYDSNSAALQWSYLPPKVRETTEKISKDICTFLDKNLTEPNEVISIGVRLARELGVQTLATMDDHPDNGIDSERIDEYIAVLTEGHTYFSDEAKAFMKSFDQRFDKALKKRDLLPFYRYLNSPKVCQTLIDVECLTYLRMNHPSGLDRARLAEWEVRNLMMTAYIRRASALYAGKRILVIVGCSHKPLFDRYLKQLMDVQVVQFREIETRETDFVEQAKKITLEVTSKKNLPKHISSV
jgi:Family of unknown function (DUF5694)